MGQLSVIREILMTISDRSENLKRRTATKRLHHNLEISLQAHALECPITAHVQKIRHAAGAIASSRSPPATCRLEKTHTKIV